MPSKQIFGQVITYTTEPPVASKSSPDSTQHSEWHHEHGVAHGVCHIIFIRLHKDRCLVVTFGELLHKLSFLPQMCIALGVVFLKLHANLAPGWALIPAKFDAIQKIGPKVEGGRSFMRLWYMP